MNTRLNSFSTWFSASKPVPPCKRMSMNTRSGPNSRMACRASCTVPASPITCTSLQCIWSNAFKDLLARSSSSTIKAVIILFGYVLYLVRQFHGKVKERFGAQNVVLGIHEVHQPEAYFAFPPSVH